MLRRVYLRIISRLPRKQAKLLQKVVMALRPRAKRRAALEAARTPEARLMCIAWGVDRAELESIRDRMAALGGKHPERMLVVSDCDALFGKGSCHFEYVPARAEWQRLLPDGDYDDFVFRRIGEITNAFRAQRVLAMGTVDDALIQAMARRRPAEAEPDET
ncbi:MAG: hypothetical protein QOG62_1715 [Thermoleophilaceae bacterium]|jgi:hypothetical protein|nr:hypothetical protein [Thermoleophilaceae bacterium]